MARDATVSRRRRPPGEPSGERATGLERGRAKGADSEQGARRPSSLRGGHPGGGAAGVTGGVWAAQGGRIPRGKESEAEGRGGGHRPELGRREVGGPLTQGRRAQSESLLEPEGPAGCRGGRSCEVGRAWAGPGASRVSRGCEEAGGEGGSSWKRWEPVVQEGGGAGGGEQRGGAGGGVAAPRGARGQLKPTSRQSPSHLPPRPPRAVPATAVSASPNSPAHMAPPPGWSPGNSCPHA